MRTAQAVPPAMQSQGSPVSSCLHWRKNCSTISCEPHCVMQPTSCPLEAVGQAAKLAW